VDIIDLHNIWTPFTVGDELPTWAGQPSSATVASRGLAGTLASQQLTAALQSQELSATVGIR